MSEQEELLKELRKHAAAMQQMTQAIMILAELMAEQMGVDEQDDVPAVNGMGLATGKIYRKADDPL